MRSHLKSCKAILERETGTAVFAEKRGRRIMSPLSLVEFFEVVDSESFLLT